MNRILVIAIALSLAGPFIAHAGKLRIGQWAVENNQVTVPVVLAGDVGIGVAALDFRLNYDPHILTPVAAVAGEAALARDKQVLANVRVPGEYTVVMMGLNQNTVAAGEVATIILQRLDEGGRAEATLSISRTTLASAEGLPIPSEGSTETISFGGQSQDQVSNEGQTAEPNAAGSNRESEVRGPSRPGSPMTNSGRLARELQPTVVGPLPQAPISAGLTQPGKSDTRSELQAQLRKLTKAMQQAEAKRRELPAQAGVESQGTAEVNTEPEQYRDMTAADTDAGPGQAKDAEQASKAELELAAQSGYNSHELKPVAAEAASISRDGIAGRWSMRVATAVTLVLLGGGMLLLRRRLL